MAHNKSLHLLTIYECFAYNWRRFYGHYVRPRLPRLMRRAEITLAHIILCMVFLLLGLLMCTQVSTDCLAVQTHVNLSKGGMNLAIVFANWANYRFVPLLLIMQIAVTACVFGMLNHS